jgi:hypothetical protein
VQSERSLHKVSERAFKGVLRRFQQSEERPHAGRVEKRYESADRDGEDLFRYRIKIDDPNLKFQHVIFDRKTYVAV